jgi:lantibiotic modifying enzyme
VAHALVRLHAVAPDPRLLSAARRGLRHERLLYSPSERNWPALTSTGSRLPMLGWCHGAPGVGLVRALVRNHVSDAELDEEMGVAVATTAEGPPSHYDDLCCGALGRCEALLCIGTLLGNEKLRDAARSATDEVARRVLRHGRLGLRTVGFETRRFHPGFFQGLSGVGYQFLRAARPEAVPSVLAFEPGGGKDA